MDIKKNIRFSLLNRANSKNKKATSYEVAFLTIYRLIKSNVHKRNPYDEPYRDA